uniref:Uncharacterized protein n=1 Tax=Anguilla anguilla TaxID=7936 RepID=A0A0E9R3K5_ANGAN
MHLDFSRGHMRIKHAGAVV